VSRQGVRHRSDILLAPATIAKGLTRTRPNPGDDTFNGWCSPAHRRRRRGTLIRATLRTAG